MSLTFNYKFLLKWIFLLHYFLSSLIFPSFFSIFILLCQAVLWVFPFRPCFKYCIGILRLLSVMMRVLLLVLLLLSLQSCPTLCNPIDSSPPGSPVPGVLQARTLEWVAISFSSAWKWKVNVKLLSCVRLIATPWTEAYLAPPSMGFSRQEYWSGLPLPSPDPTIYDDLKINK